MSIRPLLEDAGGDTPIMKVLSGNKPRRRPRVVPKSGDYYVIGLMKYPVTGYAADTSSL